MLREHYEIRRWTTGKNERWTADKNTSCLTVSELGGTESLLAESGFSKIESGNLYFIQVPHNYLTTPDDPADQHN